MPLAFLIAPWTRLAEVALTAVLVYVALVVMLRISGKRTLAKFNAFDFVVTVAIGSMVANTILNAETSVLTGVVGIAVLVALQAAVSLGVSRWEGSRDLVKSTPALLFYDGSFQRGAMARERVSSEEVRQAVRAAGFAGLGEVLAVVLETDGTLSVMGREGQGSSLDALTEVRSGEVAPRG